MNGSGGRGRVPSFLISSNRVRIAAGVVAGAALIALVGQAVLTNPRPSPSGPVAIGSPRATSPIGSPSGPSSPAPSEGPWDDLALPAYNPVAELTPSDRDRLGVAADAAFEIRSRDGTPATELARRLTVRPAITFSVKPGANDSVAVVTPVKALEPGARYRWDLTAADGSYAGAWLFTIREPIHVVTTLPGNQAVEVPLNTGIEVTFDQDGTTGVGDHIKISPATPGRVEPHGRTWAFVPDHPLAERTIYTVTVRAGVRVTGSTETLEKDVTFQFETGTSKQAPARVDFGRQIIEVRPGTQPTTMLSTHSEEGDSVPSFTIDVYRLPSFDAATDAARRLTGAVGWAVASPAAIVATGDLQRIARVPAKLVGSGMGDLVIVPVTLDSGWYILQIDQPSGPAQLLVQATNIAAYALATTESLVVWVNDLASGDVQPGATVDVISGKRLGTTRLDGTLQVPSKGIARQSSWQEEGAPVEPATLLGVQAPDGRSVIVALNQQYSYGYDAVNPGGYGGGAEPTYWNLFRTDRTTYRQTDTIRVSGLVLRRADRKAPTDVVVELLADSGDGAPISTNPVTPSARGTFLLEVPVVDLPRAGYRLQLVVHGTPVASLYLRISDVIKPAYQIEVTTDRLAYVIGDPVKVSATTTFYDGTATPGLALEVAGFGKRSEQTTDAAGRVGADLIAGYGEEDGYPGSVYGTTVDLHPVRPEEGQIGGQAEVGLFPSRVWVTGTGVQDGARVVLDGHLTWADLAAWEAAHVRGEYLDTPSGAPIAGGRLTATLTQYTEQRTQIGTRYDFIEKKVVPEYDSTVKETVVGTYPITADATGAYHLSIAVPSAKDSYSARVTAKDPEGRSFTTEVWAGRNDPRPDISGLPYLLGRGDCGGGASMTVDLGSRVDATMHDRDGSVASGGHFLYLVSRQGVLDLQVQDGPTFRPLFRDADLPSYNVIGVWQNRDGFAADGFLVVANVEQKRLAVTVQADASRYRPGGLVTVDVTTKAPGGAAIAADVILQGTDEKLYTLGQAFDRDPVGDLFEATASGVLQSFATHATPVEDWGGCGDEGGDGGGDRSDFRDSITFQRIKTDSSGHGTATFRLSDDLTSWHLTAMAAASNLAVGWAKTSIPVGLDFFAEPVLAPEYLDGDQPVLRMRGYGNALDTGDPVRFVVTSAALNLREEVAGTAFQPVGVQLPTLRAGRYSITISAAANHAGRVLRDTVTRTIVVVPGRLTALTTSVDTLTAGYAPRGGGTGMTTYVIADAGRGSLIALLQDLASSSSARFDRSAAADLARSLLVEQFDIDGTTLPASGYDAGRYQQGGVALLPYAGPDLELSALAALTVPTRVNADDLRGFLDPEEGSETRERTVIALAGRAGLGEDVVGALQAIDATTLTIREQLWFAIGLAASGDEAGARAIERDLLERHGQRLGTWVRLQVGASGEDSLEATGLLLVLAGRLGDPLAADMARYLNDQPSREHVFPLQLVAYAENALERLPRTTAKFAYTLDGTRREIALEPGGSFSLTLVPGQVSSLRLEPIAGKVDVVTSWSTPDVPAGNSAGLSVTRQVTPTTATADGGLVSVRLTISFGSQAPKGCYVLSDLLPSGLAPLVSTNGWDNVNDEGIPLPMIWPYEVEGQRVAWCVDPAQKERTFGYQARVVSPGTYRWEPAVIQSISAPELRSATEETTFTIR